MKRSARRFWFPTGWHVSGKFGVGQASVKRLQSPHRSQECPSIGDKAHKGLFMKLFALLLHHVGWTQTMRHIFETTQSHYARLKIWSKATQHKSLSCVTLPWEGFPWALHGCSSATLMDFDASSGLQKLANLGMSQNITTSQGRSNEEIYLYFSLFFLILCVL